MEQTELQPQKPSWKKYRRVQRKKIVAQIKRLLTMGQRYPQVAESLNGAGFRSPDGSPMTARLVGRHAQKYLTARIRKKSRMKIVEVPVAIQAAAVNDFIQKVQNSDSADVYDSILALDVPPERKIKALKALRGIT